MDLPQVMPGAGGQSVCHQPHGDLIPSGTVNGHPRGNIGDNLSTPRLHEVFNFHLFVSNYWARRKMTGLHPGSITVSVVALCLWDVTQRPAWKRQMPGR
jgi:hypothetical protein